MFLSLHLAVEKKNKEKSDNIIKSTMNVFKT